MINIVPSELDKNIAMLLTNRDVVPEAEKVISHYNLDMKVCFSEMENADHAARELLNEGIKVIISRGGMSMYLRSVLSIPIITIDYKYKDFARSIELASRVSSKIAIVSFNQAISAAQSVAQYFGQRIELVQIDDFKKFDSTLSELKNKGIEVIIGGYSAQVAAKKTGLACVSMQVDEDAITAAIIEARRTLSMLNQYEIKLQTILSILKSVPSGIIAVDISGKILNINTIAQELLNLNYADIINKKYDKVLPFASVIGKAFSGVSVFREVFENNGEYLALNCVPIITDGLVTGAVINLQGESEIKYIDAQIRKKIDTSGHLAKNKFENIIGESNIILETKRKAFTYASVDSTVLIKGDTGTGKELFAQSIHNSSKRKLHPFVAVNCAVLPESLLESELFGYVRGAFTGAKSEGKAGIFELAHKGTIFLDEIGEMPVGIQPRLLRVIQEKEIVRIGGEKVIPVDVRILAATNRNLYDDVKSGKFRADLYYRLSVLVLPLPPLRERQGDIRILASHFLRFYAKKYSLTIDGIDEEAFEVLEKMDFPGNVRELSNLIERSIVLSKSDHIGKKELLDALDEEEKNNSSPVLRDPGLLRENKFTIPCQEQKRLILEALMKSGGNKAEAARLLGIGRTSLWRKIKQLQL
jgi:transcriptional regulator with PAS, ATPase and Fis domain